MSQEPVPQGPVPQANHSKVLIWLAAAIIGALITGLFTPIGGNLYDLIFHQSAAAAPFPPNTASGAIEATITQSNGVSFSLKLIVTGSADGGKVCPVNYDGNPHTQQRPDNHNVIVTDTQVYTCNGTYKDGHLSLTDTLLSEKITYPDGRICTTNGTSGVENWQGTFTSATSVSGSFSWQPAQYICNQGTFTDNSGGPGTWIGIADMR